MFPAWEDNPYLNLMSLAPRASGYEFKGATIFTSLLRAAGELEASDVLHLHWTAPILQRAESEEAAWAALAEFTALLDELQARSVGVIWTVHNQLPHELEYREAEIALYRLIADRADAIHVMSPATSQMLAGICDLPSERIRAIPHLSYLGVYGAPPSKGEARSLLGIDDDEPTVLFLGQMRPYKGLGTLLASFRRLAEQGSPLPTLLLAGSASPEAQAEIEAALPSEVRTITRFGFVPEGEVGTWFAAADVAVFPYTSILNSGSLHLSAAFNVPVVLPGEPHLVAQFGDEPWVRFFDLGDPVASMAAVITESTTGVDDATLADRFDAFNESISPWLISRRYSELLDDVSARSRASIAS